MFQIPTPILDIFGYTTNKFDSNYTPGDLLSTEGLGLKNMFKGFRVAGDSGIGLYWMGIGIINCNFVETNEEKK